MGSILKTGKSAQKRAAKAAEKAAEAQRKDAQRQHEETLRQAEMAEQRNAAHTAEMAARAKAAETLQQNLLKIAQDKTEEIPDVVLGGGAEEADSTRKRKRKQNPLSATLGIS